MKAALLDQMETLLQADNPLEVQKEFSTLSTQFKQLMNSTTHQSGDEAAGEMQENTPATAKLDAVNKDELSVDKKSGQPNGNNNENLDAPEGHIEETQHEMEGQLGVEDQVGMNVTPKQEAAPDQENITEPGAAQEPDNRLDDGDENKPDAEPAAVEVHEPKNEKDAELLELKPQKDHDSTDAESEEATGIVHPDQPLHERFADINASFKSKLSEARAAKKRLEEETVATAKHLLEELQHLVEKEENIGKAFTGFNAIQEKWKSLPKVSNDNYRELNSDYNKQVERFFYNINIYKELKELDLKRNLEEKLQVIEDQKKLLNAKDIRLLEVEVRLNQDRWNEIGPTFKEEWEKIKDEFWNITRDIYKRIHEFYEQRRGEYGVNLAAKQALLEKAKHIASLELKSHKKWQERTNEIVELQKQWKSIGFVPKDKLAPIWKEFLSVCDGFFSKKREHFAELHTEQETNKKIKEDLIAEAEKWKDSTDWKLATDKFIELQKTWKATGPAIHRDENRLWREFREICDHFFNARNSEKSDALSEEHENLKLKNELIDELSKSKPDLSDVKNEIEKLRAFSERYRAIGHVPFKEKDRINKTYRQLMDERYALLKVDKKEKEQIRFEEKLELLKSSDAKTNLISKEMEFLRGKISKLESEIIQYENNLGFFGRSKGAEKLIAEVQKNIDRVKEEVEQLYSQLNMLKNA